MKKHTRTSNTQQYVWTSVVATRNTIATLTAQQLAAATGGDGDDAGPQGSNLGYLKKVTG